MFCNCEEQWTIVTSLTLYPELRKILKFHLISRCGNFVETSKFNLAETPHSVYFQDTSTSGNWMRLRYFMQHREQGVQKICVLSGFKGSSKYSSKK